MRYQFLLASLVLLTSFAGCDSTPETSDPGPVDTVADNPVDPVVDEPADDTVAPPAVQDGVITVDGKNTKLTFVGRKTDGSHTGGFESLAGTLKFDPEAKELDSIDVQIHTPSLYSDDPKLTNHLKSADFFNVREHPAAAFTSSEIKLEDGQTMIHGELTLLDQTKPIVMPAVITFEDGFIQLESQFEISRKEFGMTFGDNIEDTVEIKVNVDSSQVK